MNSGPYQRILREVVSLLEQARRTSARAVNTVITTTYWEIGRTIVEYEQRGGKRAEHYGKEVVDRLSVDLTAWFGRGFGRSNLFQMRAFYLAFPKKVQTVSELSGAARFPLPWSHYVRLLSLENPSARSFYTTETLRSGWSFRQLDRQVSSQFYERTALSRNKAGMLDRGPKQHTWLDAVFEYKGLAKATKKRAADLMGRFNEIHEAFAKCGKP